MASDGSRWPLMTRQTNEGLAPYFSVQALKEPSFSTCLASSRLTVLTFMVPNLRLELLVVKPGNGLLTRDACWIICIGRDRGPGQ